MTFAKTFAALVERMNKQIAEWDEDEPRDDWWQYQRDFATAAHQIAEALGERERLRNPTYKQLAEMSQPWCCTVEEMSESYHAILDVMGVPNAIEAGTDKGDE